jgi:hypothetical protein
MNLFACCLLAAIAQVDAPPRADVVIVVGASGTPEYGEEFKQSAEAWRAATERGGAASEVIGQGEVGADVDRELLREALASRVSQTDRGPFWLVLLGHGTFDGSAAKFNLRGADVSAVELNDWLKEAKRPVAVINCSSASGPFINALSAPERVVVTATRSGNEVNFARFGDRLAKAIGDSASDLDKDEQVSLLEAFLVASGRVAEFYRDEARLATEHALLDDNGDQLGTPADWFTGVRATKRAKEGATLDGARAHQFHLIPSAAEKDLAEASRQRRDELEASLETLRARKPEMEEEAYYAELEKLMVELARVYQGE